MKSVTEHPGLLQVHAMDGVANDIMDWEIALSSPFLILYSTSY